MDLFFKININIFFYVSYFVLIAFLPLIFNHLIFRKTAHTNKNINATLQPIRINLFLHFQIRFLSLTFTLFLLAFFYKYSKNDQSQLHIFSAFHIQHFSSFILLFNSAILLLLLNFIEIEYFAPPWLYHTKRFVNDPKPYNPIFGLLFRSLSEETKNVFKGIKNSNDFIFSTMTLFESTSNHSRQTFYPIFLSFWLTNTLGYLCYIINFSFIYISFFTFYHWR